MKPLYTGAEWSVESIQKTWDAIAQVCKEELDLDYYEPQLEIITVEQMLDCYSSVGMPHMYPHWTFGKSFIRDKKSFDEGRSGLAYEMVINSDPMVTYLMESNSMTMQTCVMAHAVCGHGSFFKNNYMFKEWTHADSIIEYLQFAKEYIISCEEQYGALKVEVLLDACHSIQDFGVDKYKRGRPLSEELLELRQRQRDKYVREQFNDLWRTLPEKEKKEESGDYLENYRGLPEENLLYFIEKHSPILEPWEREVVRIVRKISQYFYPQRQTKLMNEGWATFVHYHLMEKLFERGLITAGSYLEFLDNHCGVIAQSSFHDGDRYGGINPYALGFNMFTDLKRICEEPDEEDKRWFPYLANTDWKESLKDIVENYRDDSFILQFLSPKMIRKFRFVALNDKYDGDHINVHAVHDDEDLKHIREVLADQYSLNFYQPQIEITKVNWHTNRRLSLSCLLNNDRPLTPESAKATLQHMEWLWGFRVDMHYIEEET